jgi:hypothetical protein
MLNNTENRLETNKFTKRLYIPDVFDIMMARRENSYYPSPHSKKSSYENLSKGRQLPQKNK